MHKTIILACMLLCFSSYAADSLKVPDWAKPLGPLKVPFGYGDMKDRWKQLTFGQPISIPVCWEDARPGDQPMQEIVRSAVANTWEHTVMVDFKGWRACKASGKGVRIHVNDEGPHTYGLGAQNDGRPSGMVLNFDFQKWNPTCSSSSFHQPQSKYNCVHWIAVHEFGHILGLAHEQSRPDTPQDCADAPKDAGGYRLLTPWDENSVMNYCNPNNYKDNSWVLSDLDIKSIQIMYPPRQ